MPVRSRLHGALEKAFRKEVRVLVLGVRPVCAVEGRPRGPGQPLGALATAGLFPVGKPLDGLGPVVSAIHNVCHQNGRVF